MLCHPRKLDGRYQEVKLILVLMLLLFALLLACTLAAGFADDVECATVLRGDLLRVVVQLVRFAVRGMITSLEACAWILALQFALLQTLWRTVLDAPMAG